MQNISQIEEQLTYVMEERAPALARETRCIQRERKFDGAALLQMLVFGWLAHPDASLEQLASTVATRDVLVTDTAVHSRFNESCTHFLHAVLQELTAVVVQADQDVPLGLLRRFSNVVIEDSSSIALPDELAEIWQGCGGHYGQGQAAVKIHVRWEIKRGQMWGPNLTNGRASDRSSPFNEDDLPIGSLYVADLGYFNLDRLVARRAAKSYTLTRPQSSTAFFTEEVKRLQLKAVLPQRVGQTKEMSVLVGIKQRHPMRLLMLRVPPEVAEQRRKRLLADASRLQKPVSAQALELTKWLLLLSDAPTKRLSLQEAIVLQRERWQIEILSKLWKQYGQIDEWRTSNTWRILCELYAKLIGVLLQHWLIVLFAWQDEQRSLVKLAQVIRDGSLSVESHKVVPIPFRSSLTKSCRSSDEHT